MHCWVETVSQGSTMSNSDCWQVSCPFSLTPQCRVNSNISHNKLSLLSNYKNSSNSDSGYARAIRHVNDQWLMDSIVKYVKLMCSCVLPELCTNLTLGLLQTLTMANYGKWQMSFWLDLLVRPEIRDHTNAAKDKVTLIIWGQYISHQHSRGWQCFCKPLAYKIPKGAAGMHQRGSHHVGVRNHIQICTTENKWQ